MLDYIMSHFELTWLEIVWGILILFHFGIPALYILLMRHVALKKPWNIKMDPDYEPSISIIIPTYNEVKTIKKKLDNLSEIDYPKEKIEIIVVDSASTDGTLDIIKQWNAVNHEMRLKLVSEPERHGMVPAINHGLKYAVNEVIIKTDADCMLLRDSIKNAIKYLADEKVGSVAGLHIIEAHKKTNPVKVEKTYRNFYKWLRLGESKLYSTVLYEGEFMLVKRKLLEKIGGFDEDIGADDSPLALRLADQGYRAITAEGAYFVELTPYTWKQRFQQKVRRARHILQTLWKFKHLNFRDKTPLARIILPMETYIYVVNPLLAILLAILSLIIFIKNFGILFLILFLAVTSLVLPWLRNLMVTHVTNILIMLVAIVKELTEKEHVTWQKISEIRQF